MNTNYKQKLFHQTPLKILSFLSKHPGEIFCEGEIKKSTKSSTGSTNQTLRLLLELDIVSKETKGNVFLYKLNDGSLLLKNFKIFETLLHIHNLLKETIPYSHEIVLYGSCADCTNSEKSDIDIFVKTEYKSKIQKIVSKYRAADDKLNAVVLDPLEIASSRKADEVFYREVKNGVVLWRGKPTYEEI